MRIWLLPSAFYPHVGGVEEATFQLSRELQRQGHEVLVVTNRHPPTLSDTETIDGVTVRRVVFDSPRKALVPTARFAYRTVAALGAVWKEAPPRVVHVNCVSNQILVATMLCRLRGIPLVLTTQGEVDMDADRVYQRSSYARRMFRLGVRASAALTACSAWTIEGAAEIAPGFREAVVIPNGIDAEAWSVGPRVDEPIATAWGRHVEQKGFDLLIDAWPLVRRRVPGARLLVGGEGRETAKLMDAATEGIEFCGVLDHRGVQQLLNQSRIAVVPSRIEPFGIVALEAMAVGRPVVWSELGGLREATGGLGWAVDPRDPVALATSIVAAFNAPDEPERWRSHAESLSWRAVARRYLDVYEAVL